MNIDSKELDALKQLLDSYVEKNGSIAVHGQDSSNLGCTDCYSDGACKGTCRGTCYGCAGYR